MRSRQLKRFLEAEDRIRIVSTTSGSRERHSHVVVSQSNECHVFKICEVFLVCEVFQGVRLEDEIIAGTTVENVTVRVNKKIPKVL